MPGAGTGSPRSGLHVRQSREAHLLTSVLSRWTAGHPEVLVIEDAEPAGTGRALVEASAKARLLVVGRRQATAASMLGPVAHAVLHHASCPVAVVPEA